RVDEAVVAHVEHVAHRPARHLPRQVFQEGLEPPAVDARAGVELPDQGRQAVAEFRDSAREVLDLRRGPVQRARLGDALGGLGGEYEAGRRFVAPLRIGRRLLRTVVGAVDLDGRKLAAGVFQLAPLDQALRIEVVAPRRVGPAADANADAVDRQYAAAGRIQAQAAHGARLPDRGGVLAA